MFFVDMDGVLFDWEGAALKLFGFEPESYSIGKSIEEQGKPIAVQMGISGNKLWREIDKVGRSFWANLEPYPWAETMIAELARIDEVFILSSPSMDPSSCAGKLDALHKFFGNKRYRDYLFSNRKHLLAQGGRTLIDDKEKHVDGFTKAGGNGILFPRPWNRGANKSERAYETVMETVRMLYPKRSK